MKSLKETIARMCIEPIIEKPRIELKSVQGLQDDGSDLFEISLWFASQHPADIAGYNSIPKDWTWLDLAEIISSGEYDHNWDECLDEVINIILDELAIRMECSCQTLLKIWKQLR